MTSKLFAPVADPVTPLARHRVLSPTAAVRVSPLCLGGMNYGDAWKDFIGDCNKETAFAMMDYFYESGGNFIDTANNYQNDESETWIGEWMEKRKNRDEIVLATKYTTNWVGYRAEKTTLMSNYTGNHTKSLKLSVDASLKKLKTDYIDLLYIHWWDMTTSIEELMQSLNDLIRNGKVLYLGVSDTPAWIVSKANQYARDHGLRQFSVYQGMWNAAERDFERDIVPMCEAEGMAMAPWGSLGRGKFKTEEQIAALNGEGRNMGGPSEKDITITKVLDRIAKRKGTLLTSVAMAYVMTASPYRVFPIIGGRKVEHLKSNIEALNLTLTPEEMKEIEEATGFVYGFPQSFLTGGGHASTRVDASDIYLLKNAVHLDVAPKLAKISGAAGK